MLKKLMRAILALAMLASCLFAASAAAAENYMIPFMFYSTYNNALETVINSGFSKATDDIKQQYFDQLQISYTESIESTMFYNNPDRTLEATFSFNDGTPAFGSGATALNFVINTSDSTSRSIARDAFLLALTRLNDGIDGAALFKWARSNPDSDNRFSLGSDTILVIPEETSLHYAILGNVEIDPADLQAGGDADSGAAGSQGDGQADGGSDAQDSSQASGDAPAAQAGLPCMLAEHDGFSIQLTKLELWEYRDDSVSLRFNIRVGNSGGYALNLFVNDAELNGISCKMYGSMYSDMNPQNYDDFLFINSGDDADLATALRNAKAIRFTISAEDSSNYKVVFEQPVTLDLSKLPIEVR